MMPPAAAPRLVVTLLSWFVPRPIVESLASDREEELERRTASRQSPASPTLWLTAHVTLDVAATAFSRARLSARSHRYIIRDAWRSLASAPGTSLFALLILTLGMAGATVTFSVVDAVVLRPYPFGSGKNLVIVSGSSPKTVAAMEFAAWRDHAPALDSLAAYRWSPETLAESSTPILIPSVQTTAGLFEALRAQPMMGHPFAADSEVRGAARPVILGAGLWRRLGADPHVVGRPLHFKSGTATVVAVMPEGFTFPVGNTTGQVEAWFPYVPPADEIGANAPGVSRYLSVIGRLRPDATPDQAAAQLTAATAPVRQAFSFAYDKGWHTVVQPIDEAWLGPVRQWMLLVLAAVVTLMALACANVANLLLIRSGGQARAWGVRSALGASRRQIVLGVLAESLMLSLAATALAVLASSWGIRIARAALPEGILRAETIALDLRVLFAAVAAAFATGIGFGTVPAWHAARTDVTTLLKDGGQTATAGRSPWRGVFLVVEMAFVGVLLVSSTLFVASFVRATRVDLGFDRANLAAIGPLVGSKLSGFDAADVFRKLPGVSSVAVFSGGRPPLLQAALGGFSTTTRFERPDRRGVFLNGELRRVAPNYFATAGIPVSRGRIFDGQTDAATAVMLNEAAAKELFPDREAVGAMLLDRDGDALTVTGIVVSVRSAGPSADVVPEFFVPFVTRRAIPQLLIRTSRPFAAMEPLLTAAVKTLLPEGQSAPIASIEDAFRRLTADRRFNAGVLGAFGLLAMAIAAAGVYSAMASSVSQRERELAMRVVLGANPTRLRGEVLAQAARYVAIGLAIGLPAGWWASRVFSSLLFGVTPADASTYVLDAAIIALVAAAAALVPARRASRVDPIDALKT